MKIGTDEWRTASQAIHDAIKPFFVHGDIGATRYETEGRMVTTKHRMRRDKEGVMTLCCWEQHEDVTPTLVYIKTTALTADNQEVIGRELAGFLDSGKRPEALLVLPTYPGYEDLDEI